MTTDAASIIIVDSSALISLLNPFDSNHTRATQIAERLPANASLLVPDEVLNETLNIASKKLGRDVAVAMGWRVLDSGAFVLGQSPREILHEALDQFATQPADVSYTDCLVMQWARFYDTCWIFGFDGAFGDNGYRLPGPAKSQKAS
jgi:predicted nucleic acid-binding protein